MIVCLDPEGIELIRDFYADRSGTRLLEIECEFTDDYLTGHAKRTGLAGDHTPDDALARLLPTIRSDMTHESDQIRDADFENYARISQFNTPEENAPPLARFLGISEDKAREIVSMHYLFSD